MFEAIQNRSLLWQIPSSHSKCSVILWAERGHFQVILSFLFQLSSLTLCCGMDITDTAGMFLQPALDIAWRAQKSPSSAATFTDQCCLTWSPSSPFQELKADCTANPGKGQFFKTSAPTSGARFLNPPSIYQLPWKLRAFKVSSLHLAAYVGTGGRWTLRRRLPFETSLRAFYITADVIGVDFYKSSK